MNLAKLAFSDVTDAELVIAASIIKHKTVEKIVDRVASGGKVSTAARKTLVGALTECGYVAIQIDLHARVTNPNAIVPFEVALAV